MLRPDNANRPSVCVVYGPPSRTSRGVLQITYHMGKNPSDAEHLARQALLEAVKRLKDAETISSRARKSTG